MTDILGKLVDAVLTDSGQVPLLLIMLGFLGYDRHNTRRLHQDELDKKDKLIEALQSKINDQRGEERDTLLEVIEKYHQSQTSMREAINEVKTVLITLAASRGGH